MSRHKFTPELDGYCGPDMLENRHLMSASTTAEIGVAKRPSAVDYNASSVTGARHLLTRFGYSPETGEPLEVPVDHVQTVTNSVNVVEEDFERILGEVTSQVGAALGIFVLGVYAGKKMFNNGPSVQQKPANTIRLPDDRDETKGNSSSWWRGAAAL